MKQKVFKNTFTSNSKNKEFTLSQILTGIKFGVIKFEMLPENIKELVSAELKRRYK